MSGYNRCRQVSLPLKDLASSFRHAHTTNAQTYTAMKRNHPVPHWLVLSWILLATMTGSPVAIADELAAQPNMLFIFTDDQAFDTIAAHGFDEVQTPNLDRLARSGTSFSHTYNMGSWSGAVCIASRMMLNSGRSVWRASRLYADGEQERQAGRMWSELIKGAGYHTYMTGKWHLRANAQAAFDVVRDVRPGMPRTVEASYNRPPPEGEDPWDPADRSIGGFWQGGRHWSEVVSDHAVDFLDQAAEDERPFFMYVAYNAPHDPRQSPQEFLDRYPVDSIRVPQSFLAEYPHARQIGCGPDLRDERLAPFPRFERAVQVHRREYFALITHLDQQIGRVLDALEASGKADQTWIFFTSDHGLAVGRHGLMGKQNLYDHSVRVPMILAGPGVEAGQTIDQPVYLQDVMPTTLALAGVDQPDYVEFQNLLPLLGGAASRDDEIYGCYLQLQRSIRTRTHKLILYPEAHTVRLYDLRNDPLEMDDLASQDETLPLQRRLFAALLRWQQQYDDELDLAAAFPQLAGGED